MSTKEIDFMKNLLAKGYVKEESGTPGTVSIHELTSDEELYSGAKKIGFVAITLEGEIYLLKTIDAISKKAVDLPGVKEQGIKSEDIRPVFEFQLALEYGSKLKQLLFLAFYEEDYDKFFVENEFVLVDKKKVAEDVKSSLTGDKPAVETSQAVTKGPTYH